MAIQYNSTSRFNEVVTSESSFSWSHTCNALDTKLIVSVLARSVVNSVTYNGVAMTLIKSVHETKEHGVTVRNISEDMCFSERAREEGFEIWVDTRIRPVHLGKPEFIRFEMEGEKLPSLKEPLKGCITLSENLKS